MNNRRGDKVMCSAEFPILPSNDARLKRTTSTFAGAAGLSAYS
jgi:hypothetical protein